MSVPVSVSVAAAALVLGVPVIVAGSQLEVRHRVAGAADAAALAAADAAAGWIDAPPCEAAAQVVVASGARLDSCDIEAAGAAARVVVAAGSGLGEVRGRAHAGFADDSGSGRAGRGPVGVNGWAWPSDVRGLTQGFHQGYSIDLAVSEDGGLFAPYDGVIVSAGPDSGGIPDVCLANPGWWRGTNHLVMMRHDVDGRALFSSHNHIAPGSVDRLGLRPGSHVVAGQRVATAGMTGCTEAPHSHFTLSRAPSNAVSDVNPLEYLGEP